MSSDAGGLRGRYFLTDFPTCKDISSYSESGAYSEELGMAEDALPHEMSGQ